ncbi:hypothetical protein [Streptomyces sp. NPDC048111]|uniref:hypothetical protein n=1 Tax=Streptomyces sp. NPDC048111 TaxID=3365500 RepID=UPI003715EFEA
MAVLTVVLSAVLLICSYHADGLATAVMLVPVALAVGVPLLIGVSALLTAAYVLPAVALGHWLAGRPGRAGGRRWVVVGSVLGLLPVVGLPTAVCMLRSGTRAWPQLALDGGLLAGCLWLLGAPALCAVHLTVRREDAGRPVRPVGRILGWGILALTLGLVAGLVCG